MKKTMSLFSFLAMASALVIGGVTLGHKEVKKAKAELEYNIEMTTGFFTDWVDAAGTIRGVGANCWNGKSLNALGSVFDGCLDHEGWTGTLHSRKWNQTTEWIYFQYGCANNSSEAVALGEVKLVFKLWASEDAETPSYQHDFWNDTFSQTTMVLRNYQIPTAEYNALGGNFYMSVDLVDGREDNYGANEFGYLHVNQTHQQVSDAQWYYYTHCVEGESASVLTLRNHYRLNSSLRNGFVYSDGFAESFDTQSSFDANWVKDIYGNDAGERHQDRVISESTYRTGGWNLPFNNTNGFFKGWYGGGNDDRTDHEFGYVASDDSVYRFISKPFRLPANGIVSIKMAGNSASLHLIDFESDSDLAWVDCKTFISNGDDHLVATGEVNACTMIRHVVNFSKYGGRLVQIGIADVNSKDGGWNAAYFDELKADYLSFPGFKVEVAEQDHNGLTYAALKDVYVTSKEVAGGVDYAHDDGPANDTSDLKEAYEFLQSFYCTFRANGSFDYLQCNFSNEQLQTLCNNYSALSDDAEAIVALSDEFTRGTDTTGDWYRKEVLVTRKVGPVVESIISSHGLTPAGGEPSNSLFARASNSFNLIIIVVSALSLMAVGGFFFLKKKKEQN